MSTERPTLLVDVLIEREAAPNRWEDWRFRIAEVRQSEGDALPAEPLPAECLADDGRLSRWLHRGFAVELHTDEAEGYWLNLSSGAPVWFVMWRVDEADAAVARPEIVTLSYHEAGRWLDAQERVDNLPLPAEVRDWLAEFTAVHFKPEPKKRRRPASFLAPDQRG